jgi:hypothetical protein
MAKQHGFQQQFHTHIAPTHNTMLLRVLTGHTLSVHMPEKYGKQCHFAKLALVSSLTCLSPSLKCEECYTVICIIILSKFKLCKSKVNRTRHAV